MAITTFDGDYVEERVDANGNTRTDPRETPYDVLSMGPEAKSLFVPVAYEAFAEIVEELQNQGVITVVRQIDEASFVVDVHPENIDIHQDPLPIHQKIIDNNETVAGLAGTKDEGLMIPQYSEKYKERIRTIPHKIQSELVDKLSKKPERSSVVLRMSRMGESLQGWTRAVEIDGKTVTVGTFFDIKRPVGGAAISVSGDGQLLLNDPTDKLGANIMQTFLLEKSEVEETKKTGRKALFGMLLDVKTHWKMNFLPSFYQVNPQVLTDLFRVKYNYDLSELLAEVDINKGLHKQFLMNLLMDTTYEGIDSYAAPWNMIVMLDTYGRKCEVDLDWYNTVGEHEDLETTGSVYPYTE